MTSRVFFLTTVVALAVAAPCDAGGRIIQHIGGVNPINEGFTLKDESGGEHIFKAVKTPLPPFPLRSSWLIDTGTGGTGVGAYQKFFPALAGAWKLNLRLRLLDIDTLGGQSVHVGTGVPMPGGESLHFDMRFGTSADGDPVVAFGPSGAPFEVQGGAGSFHNYSLWVDTRPENPRSFLLVNNNIIASDGGYSSPNNGIVLEWGDLNPAASMNNSVLWNIVNFRTAIPEPSAFLLAILGLGGLACGRRKRNERDDLSR